MPGNLALTILVLAAGLLLVSPALARHCAQLVVGNSEGATNFAIPKKADAIVFSKQSWVQRCNQSNLPEYCDTRNIDDREILCSRVPNGVGGWNHTCLYKGKPCKP
jgi:hypothetical protein